MDRAQDQPAYQYKELEYALSKVFGVAAVDMPAFRARIRHLRNLGIPEIKEPGSGHRVTYTRTNAVQLLIALEVELLGLPPGLAASFVRSQKSQMIRDAEADAERGKRYVVAVEPRFSFNINQAWIGKVREGDIPLVDPSVHRRTVINLATSINLLDAELRDAVSRRPGRSPARLRDSSRPPSK